VSSAAWSDPLPIMPDVVVRRWTTTDAPGLVSCFNDAEIARWLRFPQPDSIAHSQDFIERSEAEWQAAEAYRFAIAHEGGELLGSISLRPAADVAMIGFWLASAARGRGIATRAVEVIYGWAKRTFAFDEYLILVDPENLKSQAVARRASFVEQPNRVQVAGQGLMVAFARPRA
jgi:RimJ/RimL family protein N-acetyltransferase